MLLMLLGHSLPHVLAQSTNSQELFSQIFGTAPAKNPSVPETNALKLELMALTKSVNAKLGTAVGLTKIDFSTEFKELDAIYERHKENRTDDLAAVLRMKADLYIQVLHQPEPGVATVRKLVAELPETRLGKEAAVDLEYLLPMLQGRELRDSLKHGEPFPDFSEKDLNGQPLSLHALKGKVVMLDFWSIKTGHFGGAELPGLLERYRKYHDQGFEIIGVSMDADETSVRNYIKTNGMVWPQFFDGRGKHNKLALKYGVYFASDDFLIDAGGNYVGGGFYSALYDQKVEEAVARRNLKR